MMRSDSPPAYDSALSKKLTPACTRRVETRHRGVDAELAAEGHPRSEREHTDLEAAAAEASVFHDGDRTQRRRDEAVDGPTEGATDANDAPRGRRRDFGRRGVDTFPQGEDRIARRRAGAGALPDEIVPVVGFLTGRAVARACRCRVGDARRSARRARRSRRPVRRSTVTDLDRAISTVQMTTGAGSAAARRRALGELFAARHTTPRPISSSGCSPASCARVRSPG